MSTNQLITEAYEYVQTSATVNIATSGPATAGYGYLYGIFVSAASATPTITVYDEPAAGTTTKIIDTFTPVPATFYLLPAKYRRGCNVVITGTVSATIFFNRP
ncbi:MAG: hypothetical protein V4621_08020 [Pseudomonadota bacterium]